MSCMTEFNRKNVQTFVPKEKTSSPSTVAPVYCREFNTVPLESNYINVPYDLLAK